VPFTSKISNFEGKLLKFLTQNPTYYETSYSSVAENKLDCYSASDKVVVDEFIEYLVSGVAVQYEDIDSIKHYIAPIKNTEDSFFVGSCSSKSRMF